MYLAVIAVTTLTRYARFPSPHKFFDLSTSCRS